jgi:anti-anti-sigma factor
MDLGDSWERADNPEYPAKFSDLGIRIGANYVVYAWPGSTEQHIDPVRSCYILVSPGRSALVSLQIQTTRVEPDIVVVQLSGSITSRSENIVEPMVNNQLDQNEKKLIFDLTGVQDIDSTGANMIIQCFLAARKSGGGLRVAGASAKVARLFKITRLDAVIPCYPTVAAACEGFTLTPETSE